MGKRGRKLKYDERILELMRQGYSLDETAHQVGVSTTTVYNCMKRHGLVGKFHVGIFRNSSRSKSPTEKPARKRGYKKAVSQKVRRRLRAPFTLMIIGDRAGIKVLPTSRTQYDWLLELLKEQGGEVI